MANSSTLIEVQAKDFVPTRQVHIDIKVQFPFLPKISKKCRLLRVLFQGGKYIYMPARYFTYNIEVQESTFGKNQSTGKRVLFQEGKYIYMPADPRAPFPFRQPATCIFLTSS